MKSKCISITLEQAKEWYYGDSYVLQQVVDSGCVFVYGPMVPFNEVYEFNTFADGTPFGIKE